MNTATANLEKDHVHILKLTDVMEQIVKTKSADLNDITTIVELIRNFADGLHHAKEENLLFPKMAEKGFSPVQGPVAVMLNDHTMGRNFVKGILENMDKYNTGDKQAMDLIYSNMIGYVDLLRAHIAKENNILFRMADNVMSAEEQQSLLNEFKSVENSSSNKGLASYAEGKIDELTTKYKAFTI